MLKRVAILLVAMQLGLVVASDPYITPKKSGSSKKEKKSSKKSSSRQGTPKKEVKEGFVKLVVRVDGMDAEAKEAREVVIHDIKKLKEEAQGKNETRLGSLLKRAKKVHKKKLSDEEGLELKEASGRKQQASRLEAQKAAERRRAESEELRKKDEERRAAKEAEAHSKKAETASDRSKSSDDEEDEEGDELFVAINTYKDASVEDRVDAKQELAKAIKAEFRTGVTVKQMYERVKAKIAAEKPDLEATLKSVEDVFKANGLILDEVKDAGSGDKGDKVPVGVNKDDKISKPLLARLQTKKGVVTLIAAAIAGYLGYNYGYLRMKNKKNSVTVK